MAGSWIPPTFEDQDKRPLYDCQSCYMLVDPFTPKPSALRTLTPTFQAAKTESRTQTTAAPRYERFPCDPSEAGVKSSYDETSPTRACSRAHFEREQAPNSPRLATS